MVYGASTPRPTRPGDHHDAGLGGVQFDTLHKKSNDITVESCLIFHKDMVA